MQTVGIRAALHQTAGELVDDDDLVVVHDVLDILHHDVVGF